MLLGLDKKNSEDIAIIDSLGNKLTYGDLLKFTDELYSYIKSRTLIFILCENSAGALAGYVSCLCKKVVPLLISANTDCIFMDNIINIYHPSYLWVPDNSLEQFNLSPVFSKFGYTLVKTNLQSGGLYNDLSLLLTTSGSTGSPKFVRHSYGNIESNARNVATVFGLDKNERGMVSLPLQFTQGLNVATSHLYAGSTVLLSTANLMQKEFWNFFKEEKATSFTGVPYSIEVLDKLRFFQMQLPYFKTLNQGGGRMSNELFAKCAQYALSTNRRFIATYGSTETTSRMAYLPPELAIDKCGSIGIPLPEATITLVDDDGTEIVKPNETGEIVYRGPNVTLGYAECAEDLSKGDDRNGVFFTGDLAYRDEDGCHFIVGRKKRFLKLFGYRISLDETERLIKGAFQTECACTGNDKNMYIYLTDASLTDKVRDFISSKTGVYISAFLVRIVDVIPKNDAGKTIYEKLPK